MDTSIANLPYPSIPSMRPLKALQPRLSLAATPASKPKLSLNTTTCQQRTLGRGSTGLRLDTLNVSSPTAQNTYRNVFDTPTSTPSLESDAGSASTPFPRLQPSITRQDRIGSFGPASPAPNSTSSPVTLLSPTLPYEQPANLKSILRNRPGSSGRKRSSRRPQFAAVLCHTRPTNPAPSLDHESIPNKRVCFQQPLSVDIETSLYVLKHSDLPSRSPSPSPIVTSAVDEDEDTRRPSSSSSSLSTSSTDDSADSSPATPVVTQFRKRERNWVWTLGPIKRRGGEDSTALEEEEEEEEEEGPAHKKSMLAIDIFGRQEQQQSSDTSTPV